MRCTQHLAEVTCPLIKGAELFGDVWTIQIIAKLLERPMRWSELELAFNTDENVRKLSTRTLSDRLHTLQERNILKVVDEQYTLIQPELLSPVVASLRQAGKEM